MNKTRRQTLADLRDRLSELQEQASNLQSDLQDVLNEEQEYLDNMPESMAEGEKGTKAQSAIDTMENIIISLGEFCDIDTAQFDEAAE